MAKSARCYEVFLPQTYINPEPVEEAKFDAVEQKLLDRFGGLTSQQRQFPLRGIWQGASRVYLDLVVVLTVFDFRPRGSTRFVNTLKKELLQEFDQEEILITESALKVH